MTHVWHAEMTDPATHAIWESDPSFFFFFCFLLSSPSLCIPSLLPHPPSSSTHLPLLPLAHATSSFLLPAGFYGAPSRGAKRADGHLPLLRERKITAPSGTLLLGMIFFHKDLRMTSTSANLQGPAVPAACVSGLHNTSTTCFFTFVFWLK